MDTTGEVIYSLAYGRRVHKALHPTVTAEGFEIFSAPHVADAKRRVFTWLRNEDAGNDFATQGEAEKDALKFLRAQPCK